MFCLFYYYSYYYFFKESDINLGHLWIQIHRFDNIIITPTTICHEEWLRTDYIVVFFFLVTIQKR